MKCYKIIVDNKFTEIAVDDEFFLWSETGLLNVNPECSNVLCHKTIVYHDPDWMKSIPDGLPYIKAKIVEIDNDEYNFLFNLIANGNCDNYELVILDFKQRHKIQLMSEECRQTIEKGFDIELSDGIKHFSLTTQDQININTLVLLSSQLELIPYHADDESCVFFTKSVFNEIAQKATQYITYHVTYFNSLKKYIESLTTESEIDAITYGMEIPDNFKSVVLNTL